MKKTYVNVLKKIKQKNFGILSTVSSENWVQSSGVLYGVSNSISNPHFYIMTEKNSKKVQNILLNNKISFLIPFPKRLFSFIPSPTAAFQGKAEILSYDNPEAIEIFKKSRILKMELFNLEKPEENENIVFIKLIPRKKIICYALGLSLLTYLTNPYDSNYSVNLPVN
jgi:hypothetical protein